MDLSQFDKSKFTNLPYLRRIEKPWGYELHWTPENLPYMGKVLHIDAGKRFSLQIHDKKQETWFLIKGQVKAIWDNEKGELSETELESEKGYTVNPGQRHRLTAITDCDVVEVSIPEIGTTYRLDDDYKRPDETEEQRKKERKGM
jgi:mannose-6-phosphate isomerase